MEPFQEYDANWDFAKGIIIQLLIQVNQISDESNVGIIALSVDLRKAFV